MADRPVAFSSQSDFDRMNRAVKAVEQAGLENPALVSRDPYGENTFWAEILNSQIGTGGVQGYQYQWSEATYNAGTWSVVGSTTGRASTSLTDGYAINPLERNTNLAPIPIYSIVRIVVTYDNSGLPVWTIIYGGAPLPAGGLQYQVLQRLDTGNTNAGTPPLGGGTAGWDWVRAHSAT